MAVTDAPANYQQAARELLHETLLGAARSLLGERPWTEITMADVAAASGVSRQTLYNEFGNRESFSQALVLNEAERFFTGVEEELRAHFGDPRTAIEAALRRFLTAAEGDPLVRSILGEDGDGGLLPLVTTRGLPLVEWAGARIAAVITEGWPDAPEAEARLLAETLVRLAISYVTAPPGPPAETAASASRLLTPYAESILSS